MSSNKLPLSVQRPLWEHLLLVEFWAVWNRDNSPSYLVLSVWCVYLSTYLYFEVTMYIVAHWRLCLAKLRSCKLFDSLKIGGKGNEGVVIVSAKNPLSFSLVETIYYGSFTEVRLPKEFFDVWRQKTVQTTWKNEVGGGAQMTTTLKSKSVFIGGRGIKIAQTSVHVVCIYTAPT